MKVKQIVGETSIANLDEASGDNELLARIEALKATNPQFAAEVSKVPPIARGMSGETAKHNAMVKQQLRLLVQKYSGKPVQEELPGQTPGQEIGTVIGQPNSQGEVTVKKQDGSTAMINQQLLQPGQQPNTFQMPTQAVAAGAKVIAGPVTQGAPAMENAELSAVLRIAGLK